MDAETTHEDCSHRKLMERFSLILTKVIQLFTVSVTSVELAGVGNTPDTLAFSPSQQ
jgi:hypothetical protein